MTLKTSALSFNMKDITIETANGIGILDPLFCEVTNKQIGWKRRIVTVSDVPYNDITPAYISFKVVDKKGRQLIDTLSFDTF